MLIIGKDRCNIQRNTPVHNPLKDLPKEWQQGYCSVIGRRLFSLFLNWYNIRFGPSEKNPCCTDHLHNIDRSVTNCPEHSLIIRALILSGPHALWTCKPLRADLISTSETENWSKIGRSHTVASGTFFTART